MTLIKILPEILSNKIAAGEVIERPFSVVKELVENAIDAHSTRIRIEVEKGGRALVRVIDDGVGMSRDDAILSIERYATSKIYTDDDLFSINTLGFRGEALPSIASVSRLSLITRDEASLSGTGVVVEGGKILRVSEVGAPKGTMIEVKDLFFNTPARRKFLKTVDTEMGHIADIICGMALGNPQVRFKLTHNGKLICNHAYSDDPKGRVIEVLGKEAGEDLRPIQWDQNGIMISGWAASDRHTRSTAKSIHIFVNKRPVRDKVITHAVFEGYAGRLMKNRFPVAVLCIDIAPDQVDVNVHPTKHEIRFADQKRVHDAVARAVFKALSASAGPGSRVLKESAVTRINDKPVFMMQRPWMTIIENHPREKQDKKSFPEPSRPIRQTSDSDSGKGIAEQQEFWQKRFFSDLALIGQFHNTYIVCQSAEGLVLIDQHAAHERIVYEQILKKSSSRPIRRQRLLMPETFDPGYQGAQILTSLIPELEKAGLEVEPFGGNTFVIKAVPALLADQETKPILMEIVEKAMDLGIAGSPAVLDECYKIMACHSAIRANQTLSNKQIQELLTQLDQCENPDNCPHGRPTWVRWDVADLEKKFRRIV